MDLELNIGDINTIYTHIDLAIFDNSATAIDYLYVDKPMIMSNMFHKIKDRQSKPMIMNAAKMIEISDIKNIRKIVSYEIENDPLKEMRKKMKHYFLGDFDYSKQESTNKFIRTLLNLVNERDRLINELKTINAKKEITKI